METRYHYGGDEFTFVDFDIEMSLEVNFKVLSVCQEIERQRIDGVIEVCPANASYMVHYDPERAEPRSLMKLLQEIEHQAEHIESLSSRLVDIPVLYDDPWTKECSKRFADRHQDASVSNLEYPASELWICRNSACRSSPACVSSATRSRSAISAASPSLRVAMRPGSNN